MANLSRFQWARAIGTLQAMKMKAQMTRKMDVTKFCITKISNKAKSLGYGRSSKSSHGDVKRIVREIKVGHILTSFKIKKRLKSTNFLSGGSRRSCTKL